MARLLALPTQEPAEMVGLFLIWTPVPVGTSQGKLISVLPANHLGLDCQGTLAPNCLWNPGELEAQVPLGVCADGCARGRHPTKPVLSVLLYVAAQGSGQWGLRPKKLPCKHHCSGPPFP